MDMEKLVAEIVKRVEEILRAQRSKVLVITRLNHQGCQVIKNRQTISEEYKTHYAIDSQYEVNPKEYEEIIIYDLDNENLSKITLGIFDNSYLRLINKCLLLGKKITLVKDDIEIFKYKDTVQDKFSEFFKDKIDILLQWGMNLDTEEEILNRLSMGNSQEKLVRDHREKKEQVKENLLTKKVVTERDVEDSFREGNKKIFIGEKTLVTDMAREYAQKKGISIEANRGME